MLLFLLSIVKLRKQQRCSKLFRSIFGLGMSESGGTKVCLLPLSESSLLLWCLLLFIVVCRQSSSVGTLHKPEQTRSIVTGRTDDKTCKLWWRNNLHRVIWFTPCIFLSQQPPGNLLKWILTQIINLVAWLCLSVLIYCVRISVPGHREENITSQQCETSTSLLIWQHTNPTRICTQHSHCSAMSTRRNHMQHTHTHTGRYAQHCCEFGLRRTKTHRRGP